ncbi:MAG: hypothetical protein JW838_15935 [Spirochaetes bacterium]|nr:hypothetical protein [Spirochaetota bacterium]
MSMIDDVKRFFSRTRPWAMRALYLGFMGSFMLPYVTVTGCSDGKVQVFRGYDLFTGYEAVFYLAAILIVLSCLALSFVRTEPSASLAAFASAWRAISAALCGLIVGFIPRIQHLFDSVSPHAGQILGLVCAAALFAEGAAGSARGYIRLRRDRPPGPRGGSLRVFHGGVLLVSLAMVPFYFIGLGDEWGISLLYLFLLTLPFILVQLITLEGVRRGEAWPRTWALGVTLFTALALALTVMLYF